MITMLKVQRFVALFICISRSNRALAAKTNYCTCNVDCMVVMYAPFIPCVLLLAEYVQGVLGYNFAKIRVFEVACR